MENKIIEIKKPSELIIKSNIDGLQECIKEKDDFKENIYIFLLNISKLVDEISEYKFSISPSNLYYDYQ